MGKSVIEKLKQLREFVGSNDTYSENDLSKCLREAHFNVHVAAERLMTGEFQPSKKQKKEKPQPPSSVAAHASVTPSRHVSHQTQTGQSTAVVRSSWTTNDDVHARTTTPPAAPNSQHQQSQPKPKPAPSSSSSSSRLSTTTNPVTPKTPLTVEPSPSSASSFHLKIDTNNKLIHNYNDNLQNPSNVQGSGENAGWLLCERWISDGINIARNGSCDYREVFYVPEPSTPTPVASISSKGTTSCPTLRFRSASDKMQGTFPKALSQVLSPLFRGGYIRLAAYALMEQRNLNTGAHVAFSLSVWIVDLPTFFCMFDDDDNKTADSNSKQFFDMNRSIRTNNIKRTTMAECAFQLLQWAQYGTPLEELIDLTSTSTNQSPSDSEDNADDSGNDQLLAEDIDSAEALPESGEEKAVPDWAHVLVETEGEASSAASIGTGTKWDEMETPNGMKVELRPYQKQALLWMTERERNPDFDSCESDESGKSLTAWRVEQIELLKELAQSGDGTGDRRRLSDCFLQQPPKQNERPIVCECGPVRIDANRIEAPSVIELIKDGRSPHSSPSLIHPLWERRYLTDASMTKAYSFFVQPFLGKARASPPPLPVPCRGGICADEMGLGKTVMLLALIQSSKNEDGLRDPELDSHNDSTLIVTPLSLLAQWQEEIETKTALSCKDYYGDTKKNLFSIANSKTDIVLTTYGTLQAEFCRQKEKGNRQPSWLLSQHWKRLILDECHQTKNHTTAVSRACWMVDAERRWLVSGTIIQNSLDDVYALMRTLKHEPWHEYGFWKAGITTQSDLNVALDRVKRLLRPIMIRRTKNSLGYDGKPILTLPDIDYQAVKVEFSSAERQFYEALYRKSFDIFHGFIEAGTASSSWLKIFSLLHRLRQTCSHVALTVKSHVDDEEWTAQVGGEKQTHADSRIRDGENTKNTASSESIEQSFLEELHCQFRLMHEDAAMGHGVADSKDSAYALKIANMLNDAIQQDSHLTDECPICLENLNVHNSIVTPCLHLFCRDCLEGVYAQAPSGNDTVTCPLCQEKFSRRKILCLSRNSVGKVATKFLLDDSKRIPLRGKSSANWLNDSTTVLGTESDARSTLQAALRGSQSSKLCKIREELEKIWIVEPGSRVLIFSQFLGFLDIMEHALTADGIRTWRLDGKLTLKERIAVLKEFGSNSNEVDGDDEYDRCKDTGAKKGSVLLISMKAGGQGLNLVSARSVFIVDPWWNAAVEDQCINRIHRIGQTAKRIYVRKFYVENSIEERIMELQRRKKTVASSALCDRGEVGVDAASSNRPSLDDFKLLFRHDRADGSQFEGEKPPAKGDWVAS